MNQVTIEVRVEYDGALNKERLLQAIEDVVSDFENEYNTHITDWEVEEV